MKFSQIFLLLGVSLARQAYAAPVDDIPDQAPEELPEEDDREGLDDMSAAELQILPLGASITYGLKSSDENGYRKSLYDKLTSSGYTVDMVGSRKKGSMEDNDNEGWPGFTIDQVHDKAKSVYDLKPNLVLLNVGTNDCTKHVNLADAPSRMENFLDDIFGSIEGVTVILSGLLVNAKAGECAYALSWFYKGLVHKGQNEGRKIVFADMSGIGQDELVDGTHPNDGGYNEMAQGWQDAIQDAADRDFIPKPPKKDF